jgi:hypothetical protein
LLAPFFAFLIAVARATPAPCAALQVAPEAGAARVDFRTVILAPSPREGRIRVTEFVGFRIAAAAANPAFYLFQPGEGFPESVSAQAMTLEAFRKRAHVVSYAGSPESGMAFGGMGGGMGGFGGGSGGGGGGFGGGGVVK